MSAAEKLAPRLAATFAARAQEAARNHERAPWAGGLITELRAEFGAVFAEYVREGDFVKGRPDEREGYVPCLDYFNVATKKGKR